MKENTPGKIHSEKRARMGGGGGACKKSQEKKGNSRPTEKGLER